ncbi:MAG: queuosine precursor transporter [Bacteroidota bacterium]
MSELKTNCLSPNLSAMRTSDSVNSNKLVKVVENKSSVLFFILGGFFIANALVAEFMGVKVFSLERTFGNTPMNFTLLGESNLAFNLTTGVLLWPIVFVMTDVINEYFGQKGVRFLSYLTAGLIVYGFAMYFAAINLPPADFWPTSHYSNPDLSAEEVNNIKGKVSDYNYAFQLVFGQGLWIIIGSITAFLIGQIVDVTVFHRIKKWTGEQRIWLRATGSTLISQLVDSFVVTFIAFYIGADWTLPLVLAISLVSYCYKFLVAIIMTPVIYLVHFLIDGYLGKELAEQMKLQAMEK